MWWFLFFIIFVFKSTIIVLSENLERCYEFIAKSWRGICSRHGWWYLEKLLLLLILVVEKGESSGWAGSWVRKVLKWLVHLVFIVCYLSPVFFHWWFFHILVLIQQRLLLSCRRSCRNATYCLGKKFKILMVIDKSLECVIILWLFLGVSVWIMGNALVFSCINGVSSLGTFSRLRSAGGFSRLHISGSPLGGLIELLIR